MGRHGLPVGVTLIGPTRSDATLLELASVVHACTTTTLGATPWPLPAREPASSARPIETDTLIAVVGAHLAGQPLNHQLTGRGAIFVRSARTSARYRLFVLPTTPAKPGLVRVSDDAPGFAIEVEIWSMPRASVGEFFADVGGPLCLGSVELEDNARVTGFLCEAFATEGAPDISSGGGWRAYLTTR
jgi:allophanate hydrolase